MVKKKILPSTISNVDYHQALSYARSARTSRKPSRKPWRNGFQISLGTALRHLRQAGWAQENGWNAGVKPERALRG